MSRLMASLQARHVRKCAIGKPWTPVEGATTGCTCPGGPVYHVVMWKNGGQHREHAGHDLAAAWELLEQRVQERAEAKGRARKVAPPALELPAPGPVAGTVRLRARTAAGVASVQFEVTPGGDVWRALGAVAPVEGVAELDWSTVAETEGPLTVRATADGRPSAGVEVQVDNEAPTVRITAPVNGDALTDPLLVYAAAHDAGSGVRAVRLLASVGSDWQEIATVEEPPYVGVWNPPADVQHVWLTAVAWDASGHQGTAEYVGLARPAAGAAAPAATDAAAAAGGVATAAAAAAEPAAEAAAQPAAAAEPVRLVRSGPVTLDELHALRAAATTAEQAAGLDAVIGAVTPYVGADGIVPAEFTGILEEFTGR